MQRGLRLIRSGYHRYPARSLSWVEDAPQSPAVEIASILFAQALGAELVIIGATNAILDTHSYARARLRELVEAQRRESWKPQHLACIDGSSGPVLVELDRTLESEGKELINKPVTQVGNVHS